MQKRLVLLLDQRSCWGGATNGWLALALLDDIVDLCLEFGSRWVGDGQLLFVQFAGYDAGIFVSVHFDSLFNVELKRF